MYRLCIFDLDGTLLNTVYALTYVTNLTLDASDCAMLHRRKRNGSWEMDTGCR